MTRFLAAPARDGLALTSVSLTSIEGESTMEKTGSQHQREKRVVSSDQTLIKGLGSERWDNSHRSKSSLLFIGAFVFLRARHL